jgi:uncharacterized membrane protein
MDIEKILDVLAERFGTTVEHLWDVMVFQARIEAITSIVTLLVGGLVVFVVARFLVREARRDPSVFFENPLFLVMAVLCLVAVILLMNGFFMGAGDIATALFNPEYWALKQVLRLLGGG